MNPSDAQSIPDKLLMQDDPLDYVLSPGLQAAVEVAQILGKPLLITGEPGTGKTELAAHIKARDGYGALLRFNTRSASQAMDLFYRFDHLDRFHDAHTQGRALPDVSADDQPEPRRLTSFITLGALGEAIFRSYPVSHFDGWQLADLHPGQELPQRAVVLIDEIDKAPRDFPNDLLDAIDKLRFTLTEMTSACAHDAKQLGDQGRLPDAHLARAELAADRRYWPLVIITSNSERTLPEPFLRRCVYHHIELPDEALLAQILKKRLSHDFPEHFLSGPGQPGHASTEIQTHATPKADTVCRPLLLSILGFYAQLRDHGGLRKRPSTAELLDWLRLLLKPPSPNGQGKPAQLDAVRRTLLPEMPLQHATEWQQARLRASLGVLAKTQDDLKLATHLFDQALQA